MCFYYEDACYHDIDVDRLLLHKTSDDEYFITYRHSNKIDILSSQLKIKNVYYEIHDFNNGDEIMYIENSDDGFFQTIRKIWNKITELIFTGNASDLIWTTFYDDEKYIEADVLENTNFSKRNCYKDELIIVLHSVVNNNLKTLLQEIKDDAYLYQ